MAVNAFFCCSLWLSIKYRAYLRHGILSRTGNVLDRTYSYLLFVIMIFAKYEILV